MKKLTLVSGTTQMAIQGCSQGASQSRKVRLP